MKTEPVISVGILRNKKISFILFGDYLLDGKAGKHNGKCTAQLKGDTIHCTIGENKFETAGELLFTPTLQKSEYFQIRDVVIGIQFHWEQKEKESFRGQLKIVRDGDSLYAINIVHLEEYLKSVISSEMSPKSSMGLLKAHAVISRSWLLAQIEKSNELKSIHADYKRSEVSDDEIIKWFDREDHELFDVCADDHCQRYQGITKIHTEQALQSVEQTHGLALMYHDAICDARFSKSCGGIAETFDNVWENIQHPYLQPIIDYKFSPDGFDLDLRKEEAAAAWINGSPPAFCNTSEKSILEQVLQDYDFATKDFYRWSVSCTQQEISELVSGRFGIDFGTILDLIPVERGYSGRLIKLKVVGSKRVMTIGKELVIRRAFSKSHLYSSAFIIEKGAAPEGVPESFTFRGAGWGHGVGLCQIGAAVMAEKGYTFDEILLHYYRGAEIVKLY